MSLNINKVMLAGNLTRDPQVRTMSGGSVTCDFGLAINRKLKSGEQQQKEEVTFVDIECWGRTAELVGQYLVKGRGAYIEGRFKLDQWDDKTTGAKRTKIKVIADMVQFTDKQEDNVAQSSRARLASDGDAPIEPRAPIKPATAIGGGMGDDSPPFLPVSYWG